MNKKDSIVLATVSSLSLQLGELQLMEESVNNFKEGLAYSVIAALESIETIFDIKFKSEQDFVTFLNPLADQMPTDLQSEAKKMFATLASKINWEGRSEVKVRNDTSLTEEDEFDRFLANWTDDTEHSC